MITVMLSVHLSVRANTEKNYQSKIDVTW